MIKNFVLLILVLSLLFCGCQIFQSEDGSGDQTKIESIDSLEIITNLIIQDSSNYRLYSKRASLHLKKGQIDPAFRDLSYAIDMNPKDPDLFILLGDVYFIIGDKDKCLSSYRKAGELDSKNIAPVLKLAETHLILQEYETAQKFIDIAINMDVNNPKAYYLQGIQSIETRDTANALLNLKIAGNLDSTYYETFMQIGAIYTALNDTTAIAYYKAALRAFPNEERAMFLIAISYQELGNYNEALRIYQQIIDLYPTNKVAFYNMGYINMVEMLDFEAAKDYFRQAINLDPSYVEAVYNIGRIYEESGDYDLARNQYKQALELKTNYPLAIDGLNRLDNLKIAN